MQQFPNDNWLPNKHCRGEGVEQPRRVKISMMNILLHDKTMAMFGLKCQFIFLVVCARKDILPLAKIGMVAQPKYRSIEILANG